MVEIKLTTKAQRHKVLKRRAFYLSRKWNLQVAVVQASAIQSVLQIVDCHTIKASAKLRLLQKAKVCPEEVILRFWYYLK